MDDPEALAAWAALVADRTRATFCLALLDGRAWTLGELARHANVAVSTATEHANRLVSGGLLTEHRQGRHRYLGLAGPEVATLIEAVAAAAATQAPPVRSLSASIRNKNLRYARTCYDHLAGVLGVGLADALAAEKLISRDAGLALTGRGTARLAGLGIDLDPESRRPLVRDCLDWTERRPHLAGRLGAALCRHALENGWIARAGTTRAVKVTPAGIPAFAELGFSASVTG